MRSNLNKTTMKALVYDGRASLREVPVPVPGPGEALVRVSVAGICKTDIEISKGYMDFRGVLGHEFCGVVEYSPDEALTGKRVVGEINAGCNECPYCRKGLSRHCPHRTVLGIQGRDGAMAEYVTLPVANLLVVPDHVPDEHAVFVEPIAAAVEILEQVHIKPADKVLIIGDGKLGLLISMVMRLSGCDPVLVGRHPEKLAVFSRLGGSALLEAALAEKPEPFDVVVEASGSPLGWELAVGRVKPRGILVLKSTYHGNLNFNAALLVIREITVVGSRCGPFAPALKLLETGLLDPTPLVSGVYGLSDAEEAFRKCGGKGALKVLLRIGEAS
ncbi:MAG: alcohol dehydrogenase catalytic domain-containing protein [Thermodesulfobacteriota bacterium]